LFTSDPSVDAGQGWLEVIGKLSGPVGVAVSIIAVAVTAYIAINAMRKTAEDSRLSSTHAEMAICLAETIHLMEDVVGLLERIKMRVTFKINGPEVKWETAYDRYMRDIGPRSREFYLLQSRHRLFFPSRLHEAMDRVMEKVNLAGRVARNTKPDNNNVYPSTEVLAEHVDALVTDYRAFIDLCRSYVGADKLEPFDLRGAILEDPDEEEILPSNSGDIRPA